MKHTSEWFFCQNCEFTTTEYGNLKIILLNILVDYILPAGVDAFSWWQRAVGAGLTMECWRSSQCNEEAAALIGEASTKTSCRRGFAQNKRKFFEGS